MAIRPVTYYQVVCDYPGCEHTTEDDGGDYSAYTQPSMAEESWDGEHQVVEAFVPLDLTVTVTTSEHGGDLTVHLCNEHEVTQ